MRRTMPILVTTAAAIIPFAAFASISPANTTGIAHAAAKTTAKTIAKTTAKTATIKGPSVPMQWGPVQVTLIVQGKKITKISVVAPTERARSAYINGIAVPMLVQETLKAQSSKIYAVSGATMTSDAFYTSLLSALKTAHL